ncbi:MAG: hypothetical protein FJX45_18660 [Alphaproteobacteria bacterium]|nr:hypothetical protein [Alphaproteobacteria bacterium]MBM3654659.1 hypothetical protein [Alphaproteobacteria bacterium]
MTRPAAACLAIAVLLTASFGPDGAARAANVDSVIFKNATNVTYYVTIQRPISGVNKGDLSGGTWNCPTNNNQYLKLDPGQSCTSMKFDWTNYASAIACFKPTVAGILGNCADNLTTLIELSPWPNRGLFPDISLQGTCTNEQWLSRTPNTRGLPPPTDDSYACPTSPNPENFCKDAFPAKANYSNAVQISCPHMPTLRCRGNPTLGDRKYPDDCGYRTLTPNVPYLNNNCVGVRPNGVSYGCYQAFFWPMWDGSGACPIPSNVSLPNPQCAFPNPILIQVIPKTGTFSGSNEEAIPGLVP